MRGLMSLKLRAAHVLFKNAYWLYEPLYRVFKSWQDRDQARLMRTVIAPGDVVLDIGANVGVYARLLSSLVGGKGAVHCFEPDATNFAHLKDAVGGAGNVTLNACAVGARDGTIDLYLSPDLGVDHRTYAHSASDVKCEVPVRSIDSYVAGRFPVRAIKMDVQGYETAALAGMSRTLAENPGIVLFMEFWPHGLKAAGSSAEAVARMLADAGFQMQLVSTRGLRKLGVDDAAALPVVKEKYWNIIAMR